MTKYAVQLALRTLIMGWLVITAVFLAGRWLPGDPVAALLGPGLNDPVTIANLKRAYGVDRPWIEQYSAYCSHLLRGDLGTSFHSGLPVAVEIRQRLPISVFLGTGGFVIAFIIGIPLGAYLAFYHDTKRDGAITVLLALGHSVPVFLVGIALLYFGGYRLQWFPILSGSSARSWVLPLATLSWPLTAFLGRTSRQTFLTVLARTNLLVLHGFGISKQSIWLRHILPNAAPQILTAMGMVLAYALAGNVFVETIFSCQGVGQLLAESVLSRDYPLLQGTVILIAAVFLTLNLAADLAAVVIDPRPTQA